MAKENILKKGIQVGKMRITFNAPVVLIFTAICIIALILNYCTAGLTNTLFFSTYRYSLLSPLTYLRLFTHVMGHADFEHLLGNMSFLLLVGPLLEEKYGSKEIIKIFVITALATSLINAIFFPGCALLGASGICFALILLSSMTSFKSGEIPLTFILVAGIYLGEQIIQGIFVQDNISNMAHIIGGIAGSVYGFCSARKK